MLVLKISNKAAFSLLLASALLLTLAVTTAYTKSLGDIPNPGHALAEVQGYFQGDTSLGDSMGKLCQSDGTNCPSLEHPLMGAGFSGTNNADETICNAWGDAYCDGWNIECRNGFKILMHSDSEPQSLYHCINTSLTTYETN